MKSPLETCLYCAHCLPSFNLFDCDFHGTKVRADESCEVFCPKDEETHWKIEQFYGDDDDSN